jgi:Tol biopolymer transport system component
MKALIHIATVLALAVVPMFPVAPVSVAEIVPPTLVQGHDNVIASASVSSDGRFIAFETRARLAAGDTNATSDVYVADTTLRNLELVSVSEAAEVLGNSSAPRLNGDGRYVVFEAIHASQPLCATVLLRDRHTRITRPLALTSERPQQIACAGNPAISADGEWIAFDSSAQNLLRGGDANRAIADVYVVNRQSGDVVRVSASVDNPQTRGGSNDGPSLSATGRFVAFTSRGCREMRADHPPGTVVGIGCNPRILVRDLSTGATFGVHGIGKTAPDGGTFSPAMSADGRYVSFVSTATNLAKDDANAKPDIYAYDLTSGSIELISRTPKGKAGNGSSLRPAMSATGRFVAFDSTASDLICSSRCGAQHQDHNLVSDVFLLDRENGQMLRLSQEITGSPWWEPSVGPAMDARARLLVFSSRHAMNLDDIRADFDLFVRHIPRQGGPP